MLLKVNPSRGWSQLGAVRRRVYPAWVTAGDLNGNGKLDQVVCSGGTSPARSVLSLSLPRGPAFAPEVTRNPVSRRYLEISRYGPRAKHQPRRQHSMNVNLDWISILCYPETQLTDNRALCAGDLLCRKNGMRNEERYPTNLSVAAIRARLFGGSVALWPPSAVKMSSASGHARCSTPGAFHGADDIVTALHNGSRDVANPRGVAEQFVVRFQKTLVGQVVGLNTREGEGELILLVMAGKCRTGEQLRGGALPPPPDFRSGEPHGGILAGEPPTCILRR
jgi:hypothetical protein